MTLQEADGTPVGLLKRHRFATNKETRPMTRTTVSRAIVRAYHAAIEEHAAAVRVAHDAAGGHCRT